MRATVRRLQKCLGNLPDRLRLVLELRTGLEVPQALSPTAVAALMHIKTEQIPQLERRALRRLRQTARTHVCEAVTQSGSPQSPSGVLLSSFGFAGPGARAAGGVEAARYAKSPAGQASQKVRQTAGGSDSHGTILGTDISPKAGDAMLTILVVLAAVLMVGILFADGMGLGPRHREWRRRWMHRLPWRW